MYKEENTWADGRSLYLTTDRGSSLKDVTAVYTLLTMIALCSLIWWELMFNVGKMECSIPNLYHMVSKSFKLEIINFISTNFAYGLVIYKLHSWPVMWYYITTSKLIIFGNRMQTHWPFLVFMNIYYFQCTNEKVKLFRL